MSITNHINPTAMYNFVEDYPCGQSKALASAIEEAKTRKWHEGIDEEAVYREIASPEFRLYEQIILSNVEDEVISPMTFTAYA